MAARRRLGRSFRRLWLAQAISATGDGMFLTAFPLLAAALTRDAVLIAGVTVATRLPWLLFSLPSGALADRHDRRKIMVSIDVGRATVVGLLGAAVLLHRANIWVLYSSGFLLGSGEVMFSNAAQSILPRLVPEQDLVAANARLTGVAVLGENFGGPPIGAALFGAAPAVPFLIDGASFALSAGLVVPIPYDHPRAAQTTRLWDDVKEGVGFAVGHPVLRRLGVLLATLNFFYFATEAVLVLYTFERLHAGKAVYTAAFVAAAAGTIATQWLIAPLQRRFGAAVTIGLSLWLWAVALVGLAATAAPIVAIALFFVLGAGDGLWRVLTVTLRQTLTPNRLLGRVNAAYRMAAQGAIPLGAAFGGAVAKVFGVRAPFVVAAVVFVLIAVAAPSILRPVRRMAGLPVSSGVGLDADTETK